MVQKEIDVTYELANELLLKHGSVRNAVEAYNPK